MKTRQPFVGLVGILIAANLLAACGGSSTKQTQTAATSSQTTTTVSTRTPPSKQEIVKSRACLTRERVRPARHGPNRQEVPHSASEMTRNGLPMTPQEYEATVRRCVTKTNSASAKAPRKK
jgi:hypothetical protein